MSTKSRKKKRLSKPLSEYSLIPVIISGYGFVLTQRRGNNIARKRIIIQFYTTGISEEEYDYVLASIAMDLDEAETFANRLLDLVKKAASESSK